MKRRAFRGFTLAFFVVALLAGCSAGVQRSLPYEPTPYMQSRNALRYLNSTGAGKITHIVYIVQENRSFNNIFMGYPGAYTRSYGYNSKGKKIKLQAYPEGTPYDIDHSAEAMFAACNGTGSLPGTHCRMNGFNNERSSGYGPPSNPQYVYMPRNQSKPYWEMASEGVVADRMFQSQLDESFVAHQYIIAAQAAWSVNLPSGAWGCEGGNYDTVATLTKDRRLGGYIRACYDYQTLGDELDKAHLTWRFYAAQYGSASSGEGAEWSSYQAVRHIYRGPDWKNVISPNWKFITDVRHGRLASFTWVTPVCDDSDHVNCYGDYGPSWVAALVNTVGKSKFWDSTAIFVQWDDWGGLYDPVAPRYYDRDSLGFRVPLIVISPYAKQKYVSHVHYETASVLRFAEDLYGLAQLSKADARASSPAEDCFDFSGAPRPFVKIQAKYPPSFFMHNRGGDNYFAPDYE